jgi:hypothetical protein
MNEIIIERGSIRKVKKIFDLQKIAYVRETSYLPDRAV